jgi:hypothetical protein
VAGDHGAGQLTGHAHDLARLGWKMTTFPGPLADARWETVNGIHFVQADDPDEVGTAVW